MENNYEVSSRYPTACPFYEYCNFANFQYDNSNKKLYYICIEPLHLLLSYGAYTYLFILVQAGCVLCEVQLKFM